MTPKAITIAVVAMGGEGGGVAVLAFLQRRHNR